MDGVRRHGVLHRDQSGKERISRKNVSYSTGELQNSNGCFCDLVTLNDIAVPLDKDAGLTAVGDIIMAS